VISVGIVLMIAYSSIDIIREAMRIFLQGTPKGIDPDEISRRIEELPSVASVHGLHIWSVSSREVFLSCHICVDSSEGAVDTDAVIKEVNHILDDDYGITHTTIQMEQNMVCMTANDHECCR
jgi:cobalt-zinc-cadmium efflux system protein